MPMTNIASRLAPFGTTVFAEISARARAAGAVDLGQGKPDFDGPDFIKEAAAEALRERSNQYAPHPGVPELRRALAGDWRVTRGEAIDPDEEITVTAGCTEAIPSAMLGLLEPGDRVVVFEPYYDAYPAAMALAGAEPVFVPLHRQSDGSFAFDPDELARACEGARGLLLNTPHNPTGKVFTRDELGTIAESVIHHDLLVFADEVYDRLVYEGEHVSIATLPGMRGRTLTMGSLGKMFSLTGWKIGWIVAAPELTRAARSAHQFLIFAVATPLQHAAAEALRSGERHLVDQLAALRSRRDLLAGELERLGFAFRAPASGYFILADHTGVSGPRGLKTDVELCTHLIEHAGVATIPPTAFYRDRSLGEPLLRFAFCKTEATLRAAIERLEPMRVGS